MLNNVFINENSLNKFSARSKQPDPITALDQASSFAGALANQVSINQNSNHNNTNSSSNTSKQTQSSNQSTASSASNTNNTAQQSNNDAGAQSQTKPTNTEASQANAKTDSKNQDASQNAKQDNTGQSKIDNNIDSAKIANGVKTRLDTAASMIVSSQPQGNQSTRNSEKIDTKGNNLPADFQKIIANLQNRKNISLGENIGSKDSNNQNTKDTPKINLLNDVKDKTTDQNKLKTNLKTKSHVLADNLRKPVLNQNNKDSIRFNTRESITSNEKLFNDSQNQIKDLTNKLANNIDRQSPVDTQTSQTNNQHPMFGLAGTNSHGLSTGNVNIQQQAIATNINSPQWGNDLSRQMVNMIRISETGLQTAELRLDPPELGPLRVTINLNDGVVNAVFSSMHANVRNAIEQSLPQLQQQLQEEGLSLGQADVGQDNQSSQQAQDKNANNSNNLLTQNQESTSSDQNIMQGNNRLVDPDALLDTYA